MKIVKCLLCLTPLTLLLAGCAVPVHQDTTIAQWEQDGQLPALQPTGFEGSRVYSRDTEDARVPR